MKINEVEAQVGITKKNIRFYEEQGLLSPRRNSENGYRDYGEAEVAILRRIKLMRKLGVPLEEIRRMQAGGTVADGMRRHLVTLERERRSLEQWKRVEVLFEEEKDGLWWGHTTRYCKVGVESGENLHNQLRQVDVTGVAGNALMGELAPEREA